MHHAVCYGVVDIGTQPGNEALKYSPAHKIVILFEVAEERIELERDGKKVSLPRTLSATYTLSLGKKSRLRPVLESWRGRPFTEEELDGFDLKNLLTVNALLNIIHVKKGEKTYGNISAISPLMKGTVKKAPETEPVFFSLADCGGQIVLPESVPDWIKAKIMQSAEYVAEQTKKGHPEPTEDEAANVTQGAADENCPF